MSDTAYPTTTAQDRNFRAPLRDILDSIGVGKHVPGTRIYTHAGDRSKKRPVQFGSGLGIVHPVYIAHAPNYDETEEGVKFILARQKRVRDGRKKAGLGSVG